MVLFVLRQPTWVARVAAGAALVVFAAIIAVLVIPATLAAIIIFLTAAGILAVWLRVRAIFHNPRDLLTRSEGRSNVRVIDRE
jgi:hypothetical protein